MAMQNRDLFSKEEIELRRDEAIRRMANTPPQPRIKGPVRPSKTRTKAAVGHSAHGKRSELKP